MNKIVKLILSISLGLSLNLVTGSFASAQMPILKGIGGDFTLTSSKGGEVSLTDFRGKVVLMFFGYTNCADICPTTMAHVSQMMRKLSPNQQAQVQVLFVSIDSEYDTPKHLNKYLSYFDPSFIGLVDDEEKVAEVAKLYSAEFSKLADERVTTQYKKLSVEDGNAPKKKGYLFSHTAKIFVIDGKGRTRGFFYTGTPLIEMRDEIVGLLKG
ncbi:SCO family protein [Shewanella sp. 202IG2-18]|uniref:SCO family protein n=1 Tax=Parashewanella hymeniacidonis TaxID=2807618 RepID=UPI001961DF34|nr:SCO family protein [Parashewanella hymeniacidonis]MBM7073853.1 SCO family protein [Parashewanella hymeniacidonis]